MNIPLGGLRPAPPRLDPIEVRRKFRGPRRDSWRSRAASKAWDRPAAPKNTSYDTVNTTDKSVLEDNCNRWCQKQRKFMAQKEHNSLVAISNLPPLDVFYGWDLSAGELGDEKYTQNGIDSGVGIGDAMCCERSVCNRVDVFRVNLRWPRLRFSAADVEFGDRHPWRNSDQPRRWEHNKIGGPVGQWGRDHAFLPDPSARADQRRIGRRRGWRGRRRGLGLGCGECPPFAAPFAAPPNIVETGPSSVIRMSGLPPDECAVGLSSSKFELKTGSGGKVKEAQPGLVGASESPFRPSDSHGSSSDRGSYVCGFGSGLGLEAKRELDML